MTHDAKPRSTIEPSPRPTQARGEIHLVVGPVGSGKSTYATALSSERGALRLTLDRWMQRLFRPDRPETGVLPWYVERAERSVEQIWEVARDAAAVGVNVVLEIGLIRRHERERFYAHVDEEGLELTVHVVEADRDLRWRRVQERNRSRGDTFSMEVSQDVFELASDLYEPLEDDEIDGRSVRRVRT